MPREDFDPPLPPNYSFAGSFGTQASIPNVYVTDVQSTVTIPDLPETFTVEAGDLIVIQRGGDTKSIPASDFVGTVGTLLPASDAEIYANPLDNTTVLTPSNIPQIFSYSVTNSTQWLSTEELIVGTFSGVAVAGSVPGLLLFGFDYYSSGTLEATIFSLLGNTTVVSGMSIFNSSNFNTSTFQFRYYRDNVFNTYIITAQPISNIAWNGSSYSLSVFESGSISGLANESTPYIGTLFSLYPNITTLRTINVDYLITNVNQNLGSTITTNTSLAVLNFSYYLLNANGLTITLPNLSVLDASMYFKPVTFFLKTGSAGTINTFSGSQFINGSLTTYSLSATYKYITLITDGSGWFITGNN